MNENSVDTFHEPFTFLVPGFNLRSTDLQAYLGLMQVEKADWISEMRTENHIEYAKQLDGHFEFQDGSLMLDHFLWFHKIDHI